MAVACTRPSKKHSPAEPVQLLEKQIETQPKSARIAPPASGSELQDFDEHHSATCLDSVSKLLESEAWIAAAAGACHPGSKRLGDGISKATDADGQITFAIPMVKRERCWSAFAVVDQSLLPAQVEIVEKEGSIYSLGALTTVRSVIPQFGPFCALQSDFDSVRIRSVRGAYGNASLTFFAFD